MFHAHCVADADRADGPLVFLRYGSFFFFNDAATTEIYTLSLHDALPISASSPAPASASRSCCRCWRAMSMPISDRKSTRLNSSHITISYAVFCLKKKKQIEPAVRI